MIYILQMYDIYISVYMYIYIEERTLVPIAISHGALIRAFAEGESKFRMAPTRIAKVDGRFARALIRPFQSAEAALQTICLKLPYVRDNRSGERKWPSRECGRASSSARLTSYKNSRRRSGKLCRRSVNRCAHRTFTLEILKLPLSQQNAQGSARRLTLANFATKLYCRQKHGGKSARAGSRAKTGAR